MNSCNLLAKYIVGLYTIHALFMQVFGQSVSVSRTLVESKRWFNTASARYSVVFGQNGPDGLIDALKRYRIEPDINVVTHVRSIYIAFIAASDFVSMLYLCMLEMH